MKTLLLEYEKGGVRSSMYKWCWHGDVCVLVQYLNIYDYTVLNGAVSGNMYIPCAHNVKI